MNLFWKLDGEGGRKRKRKDGEGELQLKHTLNQSQPMLNINGQTSHPDTARITPRHAHRGLACLWEKEAKTQMPPALA